jgi:magnesium transporter
MGRASERRDTLTAGFVKYRTNDELQSYLRDIEDHVTQVVEQVDAFRQLLSELLIVNATLVVQQQNEEMKNVALAGNAPNVEVKRTSSWAAILFAPTLIAGLYGMNFEHIPELG